MPEPIKDPKTCDHKWVHLRDEGTEEIGYRQWSKVDRFYCEKCLEQRRVSEKIVEKQRCGSW